MRVQLQMGPPNGLLPARYERHDRLLAQLTGRRRILLLPPSQVGSTHQLAVLGAEAGAILVAIFGGSLTPCSCCHQIEESVLLMLITCSMAYELGLH